MLTILMPYADRTTQLEYWSQYQKEHRKHKSDYLKQYYKQKRQMVIQTLGGKCKCCGVTEDLTLDHIRPINRKGTNQSTANVRDVIKSGYDDTKYQLLCNKCNRSKANTKACRLHKVSR